MHTLKNLQGLAHLVLRSQTIKGFQWHSKALKENIFVSDR